MPDWQCREKRILRLVATFLMVLCLSFYGMPITPKISTSALAQDVAVSPSEDAAPTTENAVTESSLQSIPAVRIEATADPAEAAPGEVSLADVAHRSFAAHHCLGNFLVRALLALTAVAQKQDTRSGLFAGRGVACVNQLLKFRSFVCLQFEMLMFTHDKQYSRMEYYVKSSLTVH